ncbi:hypothetical protein XU18_2293 [Perkinsela sp. CCAP 1560/4]|nr:hypothetical protein XU18_2293 [Perkinsela sp. CCAP 1560/4]|eukprot:KNH07022.1 hypothetical protein XU18_2293 [Perkinsela sp. CCAP 1560/4]
MLGLRSSIFQSALEIIPQAGFTADMLVKACKNANISPGVLSVACPDGPVHVVNHIIHKANASGLEKVRKLTQFSSGECFKDPSCIIQLGMLERFRYIFPFAEHWGEAMLLVTKYSKVKALLDFGLFIDELFFHASAGAEFSFLRKHIQGSALGAISLSTELYLIRDSSPGKMQTELFLKGLVRSTFK